MNEYMLYIGNQDGIPFSGTLAQAKLAIIEGLEAMALPQWEQDSETKLWSATVIISDKYFGPYQETLVIQDLRL